MSTPVHHTFKSELRRLSRTQRVLIALIFPVRGLFVILLAAGLRRHRERH